VVEAGQRVQLGLLSILTSRRVGLCRGRSKYLQRHVTFEQSIASAEHIGRAPGPDALEHAVAVS
jgi:hypothetical protein